MQNQSIDNYYSKPHQVLITLIYRNISFIADTVAINTHAGYYRQQTNKLLSYGNAINNQAICIMLKVANDDDFEQIISNDPGLLAGWLEVDVVIPYKIEFDK